MTQILSVGDICERALRRIGAYAIRSSGPRPEEMDEARLWLDMQIGHLSARARTWWLVPATATFPLTAGVAAYDLNSVLSALAPNGVEFVIAVYLFDPVINRDIREIKLLRRLEFEAIEDKLRQGSPCHAYVTRDTRPTMTFADPVPDGVKPYSVRLLLQQYAPNFAAIGNTSKATMIRQAWNLYIVTALAALLANGPVRKLPGDEVKDLKTEADRLLLDLEAYDAQEQANEPRRVRFYNGV